MLILLLLLLLQLLLRFIVCVEGVVQLSRRGVTGLAGARGGCRQLRAALNGQLYLVPGPCTSGHLLSPKQSRSVMTACQADVSKWSTSWRSHSR